MGDDTPAGGTGPDDEPGSKPGPKAAERRRKPAGPKPLPSTEAGDKSGNDLRARISEMLDAGAQVEAVRRRATAVDRPDYEAAFDRIVGPSRRRKAVEIVADLGGALGSGLVGYAVNVYTGDSTNRLPGHIAMLAGVSLIALGIVVKYFAFGG